MVRTKRNPEAVGLPGKGEGKEGVGQMKYTFVRPPLSIPSRRISFEMLSSIYRYQHNLHIPDIVELIPTWAIMAVPDSSFMDFGDWFDLCKQTIDIYEEAV